MWLGKSVLSTRGARIFAILEAQYPAATSARPAHDSAKQSALRVLLTYKVLKDLSKTRSSQETSESVDQLLRGFQLLSTDTAGKRYRHGILNQITKNGV